MNLGTTVHSKSIGIIFSGLFPEVLMWIIIFFISSHKFYIINKYISNHWVGHSKMKPIDVNKSFNRNVIINELEFSLNDDDDKTEASVIV